MYPPAMFLAAHQRQSEVTPLPGSRLDASDPGNGWQVALR